MKPEVSYLFEVIKLIGIEINKLKDYNYYAYVFRKKTLDFGV